MSGPRVNAASSSVASGAATRPCPMKPAKPATSSRARTSGTKPSIVPPRSYDPTIGSDSGVHAPGVSSISAMWAGAFAGVFTLPTNGSQIAAANFDQTGTTKLGTKLLDHSFLIPVLLLSVTTAVSGVIIAGIFY